MRIMLPKERLSQEQKGKAITTKSSPAKDVTVKRSPLDDFSLIHCEAMMDTANLDLSQSILVADAAKLFRREDDGHDISYNKNDDHNSVREGELGDARNGLLVERAAQPIRWDI